MEPLCFAKLAGVSRLAGTRLAVRNGGFSISNYTCESVIVKVGHDPYS